MTLTLERHQSGYTAHLRLFGGHAPWCVQETIMDRLACIRPQLLQGRSLPAQRRLARVFADAWETGVLSPVRLHTGSIYAPVPHETYAAVVMRFYPRDRRGQADHVWRPDLAPTATLLGQYQRRELGWREFARHYLAQLDQQPVDAVVRLLEWLGDIPARFPSVTLLCCERAPGGDECRVLCHRRLLRAWLLGEQVRDVAA
jgi:uncharacterized protein YeaO (DUF488 family)